MGFAINYEESQLKIAGAKIARVPEDPRGPYEDIGGEFLTETPNGLLFSYGEKARMLIPWHRVVSVIYEPE